MRVTGIIQAHIATSPVSAALPHLRTSAPVRLIAGSRLTADQAGARNWASRALAAAASAFFRLTPVPVVLRSPAVTVALNSGA
jgi:hypothetical protein